MARTNDTQFGGGPGMIDPERREARAIGAGAGPLVQGTGEELWEIYATNPADGTVGPEAVRIERPTRDDIEAATAGEG